MESNNKKLTIAEVEDLIFMNEEVRIIFRSPKDMIVGPYEYKSTFSDVRNVSVLIDRIKDTYPHLEFEIVKGDGTFVKSVIEKLGSIRKSYF